MNHGVLVRFFNLCSQVPHPHDGTACKVVLECEVQRLRDARRDSIQQGRRGVLYISEADEQTFGQRLDCFCRCWVVAL